MLTARPERIRTRRRLLAAVPGEGIGGRLAGRAREPAPPTVGLRVPPAVPGRARRLCTRHVPVEVVFGPGNERACACVRAPGHDADGRGARLMAVAEPYITRRTLRGNVLTRRPAVFARVSWGDRIAVGMFVLVTVLAIVGPVVRAVQAERAGLHVGAADPAVSPRLPARAPTTSATTSSRACSTGSASRWFASLVVIAVGCADRRHHRRDRRHRGWLGRQRAHAHHRHLPRAARTLCSRSRWSRHSVRACSTR